MTKINSHKFAHLDDRNMHEVKGFPSASVNYAYKKNIRGASEWQRTARQENILGTQNGYDAPTTEVNGDVYLIESPELDIDGLVWQSGTNVRITFSAGYSDIYAVGNYLTISGASNAKHNGVFEITVADGSHIDVSIPSITDGTDDVASGSSAVGYVTHEDFDPENLSNGQSIPRLGFVRYFSDVDLWFGDALVKGDEWYNESNDSIERFNGTNASVGFNEYRASLTQTKGADPVVDNVVSSIGSVTFARVSDGVFTITKTGYFTNAIVIFSSIKGGIEVTSITSDVITFKTYEAGLGLSDGLLLNTGVIITLP